MYGWVVEASWHNWGVALRIWFNTPTSGWITAQIGPVGVTLFRGWR